MYESYELGFERRTLEGLPSAVQKRKLQAKREKEGNALQSEAGD